MREWTKAIGRDLSTPIQTASNMDELKKRYQAAAKLAVEAKHPKSMRILTDFKDARKKELANA